MLRLQAPGYAEVDYVLGAPMVGSPNGARVVNGLVINLPSRATAQRISMEVGSSPAPDQHALMVRTLDCNGQRAAGVTVQTSQNERGIPVILSDDALTRRETLVTGERGVAGLIGLLSPSIDVIGVTPSGIGLGGPTRLDLRAGVITVAEIRQGLGAWGNDAASTAERKPGAG